MTTNETIQDDEWFNFHQFNKIMFQKAAQFFTGSKVVMCCSIAMEKRRFPQNQCNSKTRGMGLVLSTES